MPYTRGLFFLSVLLLWWAGIATAFAAPTISSLTPNSGAVGSSIVLSGSGFGSTKGTSTVKFNGTSATTSAWSNTSITAIVPTGATTGSVVVTVSGHASNGVTFTVTPAPNISGLSPSSGIANASVNITGSNFGSLQGNGGVAFNGVAANITSWSAGSITAKVPAAATTGNVVVTAAGGVTSNGVGFTVIPPPGISGLQPNSGAPGAVITMSGAGFGSSQGTGSVTFNGITAPIVTWTNTSITAQVPNGATTGNVVVTASTGAPSSGAHFVVVNPGGISVDQIVSGAIGTKLFSTHARNELLLAFVATAPGSGGTNTTVTGIAGGNLSWVLVKRTNAQSGTAEIWRAFSPLPLNNITVTATLSGGSDASITIVSFLGVDTSGSNGSGAIGATATGNASTGVPSVSLTTTRNSSLVFAVGEDPVAAIARTPGSNQTVVNQLVNPCSVTPPLTCPEPGDTFWVQQFSSAVTNSGTNVTLNDTAPSGDSYNLSAVEILPASSPTSGPVLTSLSAISAPPATSITISGTNFGATQGSSTVSFNGTPATPSAWTSTSIVVAVPQGATTGDVVVTVGGQPSNGLRFLAANSGGLAVDGIFISGPESSGGGPATGLTTSAGNEVLIALIGTAPNGLQENLPIVSPVQGGGLTWTLVERANTQTGTAEIWRAFSPYILDNVSVNYLPSASTDVLITVISVLGADTTGTNGSGAIGALATAAGAAGPTATLTSTRANSFVFGVGDDPAAGIARTVGTNQAILAQSVYSPCINGICQAGSNTLWSQQVLDSIANAGTSVTVNDTAPPADPYNLSIVEILPSLTPLVVTASASPAANSAGWNNTNVTVTFTCSGGVAPVVCPSAHVVASEGANQVITGTASDASGVQVSASVTLKIDKTSPTIAAVVTPAPNGKNVVAAPATVSFTCSDALSGVVSCPAPIQVTTAGLNQTFSGTAADNAGNLSSPASLTFSVETGPLTIVASASPAPNAAGWNNSPVTISFACGGGVAPVQCPASQTLSVQGAGQVISGAAQDAAGQQVSTSATVNLELTPPTITGTATPAPVAVGWNNSPVIVTFSCAPSLTQINPCPAPRTISAEGSQTVTGTVTDIAGNSAIANVPIKIDLSPPFISASVFPIPVNGIVTAPATVQFYCFDRLSGIAQCPAPVTVGTSGQQVITGQAVDNVGHTATASVTVNLESAPLSVTASVSSQPNAAGWNNSPVTVSFTCMGGVPPVACPAPITVKTDGKTQKIVGTATDNAGQSARALGVVSLDQVPPRLNVTAPIGNNLTSSPIAVQGLVTDGKSGVSSVTCNGASAVVTNGTFSCSVNLITGGNNVALQATDVAGNVTTTNLSLSLVHPINLHITSPVSQQLFSTNPVTVTGTMDTPGATVVVGGVTATVSNGVFTAAGVVLREDKNLLTASATTADGGVGSDTVTIYLDTNPPVVHIETPADGSVTTNPQIDIAGNVNDSVTGTVNGSQVSVSVNGVTANVANRSFAAHNILLVPGQNVITATATDRAGNSSQHQIHVTLAQATGVQQLAIVSGNGQQAPISTNLPQPLVVRALDSLGRAVPNITITFSVVKSDGVLTAFASQGRVVTVQTGADGQASAQFHLGSRNGVGINQVSATAPGFTGQTVFLADSTVGAAAQIHTVSGESQRGAAGQVLAEPLVAIVVDAGSNPVANVPVTFTVKHGGGSINGLTTFTQNTDSDGRVSASLVLGQQEGLNNNLVVARISGSTGPAATFLSSGLVPGPVANTTVSGIVLDDANQPIPNATASIKGTNLSALTNSSGRFTITGAPLGDIVLFIDGSTSTDPDSYPTLSFQMATIPGVDNTLPSPIYLPALDTSNSQVVGGDQDVVLTMKGVPGVAYKVFAHSVTFPDGTHVGRLTLSQVHADRVPMTPPNGTAPRLVGTLQPAGVQFNPPIQMTLPNTDGLAPGQVVDIFSFHHDIEQFVTEGPARVSDDGSVLVSDPGFGLTVSGWHGGGGDDPPAECASNCDFEDECNAGGECDDGECVFDSAALDGLDCEPAGGGCSDGVCSGGECVVEDDAALICDDTTGDNDGDEDDVCTDLNGNPVTLIQPDNTTPTAVIGLANAAANFNAQISGTCTDVNYQWQFNDPICPTDDSAQTGGFAQHTYCVPGIYQAQVTASCNCDTTVPPVTRLFNVAAMRVDVTAPDGSLIGTNVTAGQFQTNQQVGSTDPSHDPTALHPWQFIGMASSRGAHLKQPFTVTVSLPGDITNQIASLASVGATGSGSLTATPVAPTGSTPFVFAFNGCADCNPSGAYNDQLIKFIANAPDSDPLNLYATATLVVPDHIAEPIPEDGDLKVLSLFKDAYNVAAFNPDLFFGTPGSQPWALSLRPLNGLVNHPEQRNEVALVTLWAEALQPLAVVDKLCSGWLELPGITNDPNNETPCTQRFNAIGAAYAGAQVSNLRSDSTEPYDLNGVSGGLGQGGPTTIPPGIIQGDGTYTDWAGVYSLSCEGLPADCFLVSASDPAVVAWPNVVKRPQPAPYSDPPTLNLHIFVDGLELNYGEDGIMRRFFLTPGVIGTTAKVCWGADPC